QLALPLVLHPLYLFSLSLDFPPALLFHLLVLSFRFLFVVSYFCSLSDFFLHDISVELASSVGLPNMFPVINHFVLNAKNNWLLVHDPAQDLAGAIDGVVVTCDPSALVDCVFEKLAIGLQLLLPCIPHFWADFS